MKGVDAATRAKRAGEMLELVDMSAYPQRRICPHASDIRQLQYLAVGNFWHDDQCHLACVICTRNIDYGVFITDHRRVLGDCLGDESQPLQTRDRRWQGAGLSDV